MKLRYIMTVKERSDEEIAVIMANKEVFLERMLAMMGGVLPEGVELDLEAVEDTPANDNTPIPEQPKGASVPTIKIAA